MMASYHSLALLLWLAILNAPNHVDGGVVYTRWGRQTCRSLERELVYTGYVGGQPWIGGGSNYLCMPRSPTYGNHDTEYHDESAYIYGTEYHFLNGNFPFDVPEENPLLNLNALCAVCRVENASTVLMIPARTDCYLGWEMEYTGYLVAAKYDQYKTEFLCLDESPEGLVGSGEDEPNSGMFYPVESACGSLPCPPYLAGGEVACAVCSK